MTSKKQISKLLFKYFTSKDAVALAYLFGSVVSGDRHALSDIDIGVLLKPDAVFNLDDQLSLITDLRKLLDFDYVDLSLLNDAAPLLKFEVVQNGELVFVTDDEIRCDFEVRARQEYFDIQPLLELQYEYMLQRIKEGDFARKHVKN